MKKKLMCDLEEGDWFLFNDPEVCWWIRHSTYYVLKVEENIIYYCDDACYVDSFDTFNVYMFPDKEVYYIGKGKKRKWWKFAPRWLGFCPFSPPKKGENNGNSYRNLL